MSEVSELVLGLGFEEHTPGHWAFFGDENEVVRTITDLSTTNAELRAEVARLRVKILEFAEGCKDDLDSNTEGRGTQYKAGWKAGLEHLAAGLRVGVYNMSPTPKPLRKCEGCNALCEQGVCDDCSGVNIVAGWDAEMAMAIDPAPEVTL
jgi:hypothetical protein